MSREFPFGGKPTRDDAEQPRLFAQIDGDDASELFDGILPGVTALIDDVAGFERAAEKPVVAREPADFDGFIHCVKLGPPSLQLAKLGPAISARRSFEAMSRNDDLSKRDAGFVRDQCQQDQGLYEADLAATVHVDRRARPLLRVLTWVCLAAIPSLSLVPGNSRPHAFLPGQAEHFIAYTVAGSLLALAMGRGESAFSAGPASPSPAAVLRYSRSSYRH